MPYSDEDIKKMIDVEEKGKNGSEGKREPLLFELFILKELEAIKNKKNHWLSFDEIHLKCMNTLPYQTKFKNKPKDYEKALLSALESLERERKITKHPDGRYYSAAQ